MNTVEEPEVARAGEAGENVLLGAFGFLLGAGLVVLAVSRSRQAAVPPRAAIMPAMPVRIVPQPLSTPPLPPPPLLMPPPAPPRPAPLPSPRRRRRAASSLCGSLLLHALLFGLPFGAPWLVASILRPRPATLCPVPKTAPRLALERMLPSILVPLIEPPPALPPSPLLSLLPEPSLNVFGGENPATPMDVTAAAGFSIVGAGGALPDFGNFSGGSVVTVFLDQPPGGWTLECARQLPLGAGEPPVDQPLSPPLPAWIEAPAWPPLRRAAARGAVMAVAGELDGAGRLTHLHVLRSPDSSLEAAAIAALAHWRFHPASVGRSPVPVRILLGVPLP